MIKLITAAVLVNINKELEIRKFFSSELLHGQVLVKILFSGVCRSQLMEVSGNRGKDPWLPHLLGHEGTGVVCAIGEGVTKVKPGDKIILSWIKGKGIDAQPAIYNYENTVINSGKVSTFSNYSVVSENRLIKKPDNMPFEIASLFGCALSTGAGMVINELNLKKNSTVAVLGLGGIGLSALMALKSIGVEKIIAIDISEEKLVFARIIGATHTINFSNENYKDLIIEFINQGIDYCIESAGKISTIEEGFRLIRRNGGQLLFSSHPAYGEKITLDPHEMISGKKIAGSWGGGIKPDEDIPRIYNILLNSNMNIRSLITKKYKLSEINCALDDLKNGNVFRPLIVMDHN